MDYQNLKNDFETEGIVEGDLSENPIEVLRKWYQVALDHSPGRWIEPSSMALATADRAGHVTNRFVLLKKIEDHGLQFFTNYDSTKGRQLTDNPQAAVVLHWPYLGRQVRVEGMVERTSRETSEAYFHSRPRGSQLSAAVSIQSATIKSREELELRRNQLEANLDGQPVPLPSNWGGFLLKPSRFEFWQGRTDRLHDRVVFSNPPRWQRSRTSP